MITRSPDVRGAFSEGLSLWQMPPCCPEAVAASGADVFTRAATWRGRSSLS